MTTEHQRARKRTTTHSRPAASSSRRLRRGGLAAAAVLVSLTACGQSSGGASPAGRPSTAAATTSVPSSTTTPTSSESSPNGPSPSNRPSPSRTTPSGSPANPGAAKTCTSLADKLSLDHQIGQLFMAGTDSAGMSDSEAQQLASLKIGSVLLLGDSTAGRSAISSVTDAIKNHVGSDHGVQVLLAADQEGGQVQRLAGPGFDTIPSAEQQASLSDDHLQASAKQWGRQLKQAGVDVDLAPVADVVPTSIGSANQPIGALHRGYGSKPAMVARKDAAFINGMQAAGVATSVKHFPGLGIVRGNTDFDTDVTDSVTTRDDKRLAGFRAGVRTGVDMVMVSSATYQKIDPGQPATFSNTVLHGMIRGDLGFDGVIISDDLMGKALSDVPARQRALRFIRSGGDLAIVGQPSEVEPMVEAVRQAASDDQKLRSDIQDAAARVLIMKSRYGLADCSASATTR